MFKSVKEIFSLLTPKQRSEFYVLQTLVIIMAIGEVISVASIAPFMALVGDLTLIESNSYLKEAYVFSGVDSPESFLFLSGVFVLVVLTISAMVAMFTTWRLAMFSARVGTQVSDRLFRFYLRQDWLFHASGSSSQLTKKLATESERLSKFVVLPLMQMNAKIVLVTLLATAIFIYNPTVAIIGLAIFSTAYIVLYKVVRSRLYRNGQNVSRVFGIRFKLMNEAFGGIKDLILLNRGRLFVDEFEASGKVLARSQGMIATYAQVPRYLMELIAFGSMITLILYLISSHNGNLGEILPILSVYALAGMKLLPAMQQTYAHLSLAKANLASFESIKSELKESLKAESSNGSITATKIVSFEKNIALENIDFSYPNKSDLALDNLSLEIGRNKLVGIAGSSGSGKSTLIDLLLGLISPRSGTIKIDGVELSGDNLRAWQDRVGFVPQSIFLADSSIAENIAFGIPKEQIDYQKVDEVAKLAHLDELITTLDDGVHSMVGERGVQLSGGQRQRIGIARALYNDADVLVFDEATSALDGVTEKMIMNSINDLMGKKTIILIAHRLKTIINADVIFLIESGKLVDSGSFDELNRRNNKFKEMALHA